jgi:hypothetical protein
MLFPGLHRPIRKDDEFDDLSLVKEDTPPVTKPRDLIECSSCGIQREDWVFDDLNTCATNIEVFYFVW